MRAISAILGLLFLSFAALQFNDPDPIAWITWYSAIGVLCVLAALKMHYKYILMFMSFLGIIWAGMLLPGFLEWIPSEDSLLSEMSIGKAYIEESREFLGLSISLMSLGFLYFFYSKRR